MNATNPETIIGRSTTIQGDLQGQDNITIAGQVTGKVISNQSLTVEEQAKLKGDVSAHEANIAGEVEGKLQISGRLVLHKTAKVSGELACPVLVVEDGAAIFGKCAVEGTKH